MIATDIKDLDEENFEAYSKKLTVLLRDKDKALLTAKAESAAKDEAKAESEVKVEKQEEVVASEEETTNEVLAEVVDNAESTTEEVPVSSEGEQTLYDKYASAFSLDGFDININRK